MKNLIVTAFLAIGVFVGYAQSFRLQGTVVDETGKPLKGVTVYVKETGKNEIFTNSEGKFKLLVSDTSKQKTLVFLFSEYKRHEYQINTKENDIRIVMEKDAEHTIEAGVMEVVEVVPRPTIFIMSETEEDIKIVSEEPMFEVDAEAMEVVEDAMYEISGNVIEAMYDMVELKNFPVKSMTIISEKKESPATPSSPAVQSNIKAGTLTSGEVNDFAKWHLWSNILENDFKQYTDMWGFKPLQRYIAQLTNNQGMPLSNAAVRLKLGEQTLWQAKTDNTGKAELWIDFFQSQTQTNSSGLILLFEYEGKTAEIANPTTFEQGINTAKIDVQCNERNKVDIFFMVDATGSMGDEIRYLQVELEDIIQKIHKQQSELELRTGCLVYRDHGDKYLTRKSSLHSDINETLEFIRKQSAGGGGDYPEAVDIALEYSILNEEWNDDALARILFVVLDAPSHTKPENIALLESQLRLAAEKGIRIVPIACSDIKKDGEYLMRTFALATNGTYLFLTDHSGVGNAHIEPTTDKYEVEKLNDAIVRVIKQYTKMPDCNNKKWAEENKNAESSDKFVPNPYDEKAEKDAEKLTVSDIIKVYPNPCSDILKIEVKKSEVQDIYLVDMTGKTLYNFNAPAKNIIDIDVNRLSTGVYFVKVFYKGKWFSEKFVKFVK